MQPFSNERAKEGTQSVQATLEPCAIAPKCLIGTWLNTNIVSRGIVKAVVTERDGAVFLRIFGNCNPGPCDWGEVQASIFAADANSTEAMAWSAFYEFGFMDTHLQAHIRQGVLIIAKFDRFKDESARSNYFSKEFFYRVGG